MPEENEHWQEEHCPNRAQRRAKHKVEVNARRREIREKARRLAFAKKYGNKNYDCAKA